MTNAASDVLPAVRKLGELIAAGEPPAAFLHEVDAAQRSLFGLLCDRYGAPDHARLLSLKLSNYLVGRYHHARRDPRLTSGPLTLMVDPANSCQLQCPGCVHSANEAFTRNLLWPPGVMRLSAFQSLLAEYGPTALNATLYNYGEPLLNKRLPEFIELAGRYGLSTGLSTNLSVPFDVQRFVRAAPDRVILSIDGVSQEAYEKFRRRGDIALVLGNVRSLVEAKRRLGQRRPILIWRFLTFEHNVHEVDDAIGLAEELGVDHIQIGTPFDVTIDDPEIRSVESDRRGRIDFRPPEELALTPAEIRARIALPMPEVEREFEKSWLERLRDSPLEERPTEGPGGSTCLWLYYNLTADARGRAMPCCITPSQRRHLVFGELPSNGDTFNARGFELSRLSFADRSRYDARREREDPEAAEPHCAKCPKQPALTSDPRNGIQDLADLDYERVVVDLREPYWWALARWEEGVAPLLQSTLGASSRT